MVVFTSEPAKARYKVINWREYNESLVRRGDITFWFSAEVLSAWEHLNSERKVGHPFVYSDVAIEALLTLRELFRLPYRQTEGLGLAIAKLKIAISSHPVARGPIDVIVDSSGVKIYGEGEWRVRCYGVERRRTWRKLHLAIDSQTQEIVAQVLTTKHAGDAGQVAPAGRAAGGKILWRRRLRSLARV